VSSEVVSGGSAEELFPISRREVLRDRRAKLLPNFADWRSEELVI
jgi:hypothetical protein